MTSKEAKREAKIFSVETRLAQLTRRPGGVPREQAIARAQAEIESLKPEFGHWLDDVLQELPAALNCIGDVVDDPPQLEALHRRCCLLRDVGATMGYDLISVISHNLCQILDAAIKNPETYQKDITDCHIQALLLVSKPPYCDVRPEQMPELVEGLHQVLDQAIGCARKPHCSADDVCKFAPSFRCVFRKWPSSTNGS